MRLQEEFRARTKKYASQIIRLYVQLPKDREEVRVLGKQLLRSGTSAAAQTRETSRARSDAEFCSKIDGALQEADQSQLWIELLMEDCGIGDELIKGLHKETNELIAIFVSMSNKTKRSNNS